MDVRILHRASLLLVTGIAVIATFWTSTLTGDEGGRVGRTTSGCTCHGSLASPGVTVAIAGPQQLTPGSVGSYTLSVTGSPTAGGGFDLRTTGGTLVPGANNHLSGGELTHNNGSSRSWPFTWTAPAMAGSYDFFAVAVAANGTGSENGDAWNWINGAVGVPFTINVPTVGVDDNSPPALWLAAPRPNPSAGRAEVAFSLSAAGQTRLEVFDVTGRRVAALFSDDLTAGRHVQRWDGRDSKGRQVAPGVYILRLSAEGRELTTRLIRLSK